jgi:hypothetical protein
VNLLLKYASRAIVFRKEMLGKPVYTEAKELREKMHLPAAGPLDELARGLASQVENVYRIELGIPSAERVARTKVSVVNGKQGKNKVNMAYSHEIAPCPSLAASSTPSR